MKVDDRQREFISKEKEKIKKIEEQNVFNVLNKVEIEHKKKSKEEQMLYDNLTYISKPTNQPNTIWDEYEEEKVVQITPTVQRIYPAKKIEKKETQSVKLGFTERTHPNVAARESLLKEPPYPKSKKIQPPSDFDKANFEERNPIWMKDKGDNFMKNHDYVSAVAAYSRAIDLDQDFIKCYLNRATCYLCMRGYSSCVNDCATVERLAQANMKDDEEFYKKTLFRARIKNAAALCWSNKLNEAIISYENALRLQTASAKEIEEINDDIKAIQIRISAEELIEKTELIIKQSNYEEVSKILENLNKLSETPNEKIEALLSKWYSLVKVDNNESLNHCNKALDIIFNFNKDTRPFELNRVLEIELLLKKAQCLQINGDLRKAKETLDQASKIDPHNQNIEEMLTSMNEKINKALSEEINNSAKQLQKEGKFAEAYSKYEECMKLTKKIPSQENLRLSVNKAACLLSMGKYEDVICECNAALIMLRNFKTKITSSRELSKQCSEDLVQIELRLHVRRSNALCRLQRVKEALDEMMLAKECDPSDNCISNDIKQLKQMLLSSESEK